jgi:hypothetical protein
MASAGFYCTGSFTGYYQSRDDPTRSSRTLHIYLTNTATRFIVMLDAKI